MSRRTLGFALYCAVVALANLATLASLVAYGRTDMTASHLVIMPFLAAGLVVMNRQSVFRSVATGWRSGSLAIFAGAALWWLVASHPATSGEKSSLAIATAILVFLWAAGFVFFYGAAAARAALFPLLVLSLAIPLPEAVLDPLTQTLKGGSAEAVTWLFSMSGTPFVRNGELFELPGVAIRVADECSGIRSAIALLIVGLLAGHLYLKTAWKRALLVLLVLPVAMLKNGVRIVTLTLLAIHVDPDYLTGQLHHDGGVVFFVLSLILMLPAFLLLEKSERIDLRSMAVCRALALGASASVPAAGFGANGHGSLVMSPPMAAKRSDNAANWPESTRGHNAAMGRPADRGVR